MTLRGSVVALAATLGAAGPSVGQEPEAADASDRTARVTQACSGPCGPAPVDASNPGTAVVRAGALSAPATVIDPSFFMITQALGPISVVVDQRAFAGECAVLGVCAGMAGAAAATLAATAGPQPVLDPNATANADAEPER